MSFFVQWKSQRKNLYAVNFANYKLRPLPITSFTTRPAGLVILKVIVVFGNQEITWTLFEQT